MTDIRLSLSDRIDTLRDSVPLRIVLARHESFSQYRAVWSDLAAGFLLARALALIDDYVRLSFPPSFLIILSQFGDANGF